MNFQDISKSFEVNRLTELNQKEIFQLYSGHPEYFKQTKETLSLQTPLKDLKDLPPNKTMEDKYFLGFYQDNALVAVMDLILRYPNAHTAFIGFFMTDSRLVHKHIGSEIIQETSTYLQNISFKKLELGVVDTNVLGKQFWENNGFKQVKKVKQENYSLYLLTKEL